MGILNTQLIGGGNFTGDNIAADGTAHDPFGDQLETDALGFGGFSYAPDTALATLFGSTVGADYNGPFGSNLFNNGTSTYGVPGNFARMPDATEGTEKTILGQLGLALKGETKTWSTAAGKASSKMGHSFTTGSSWRSLNNAIPNENSGGTFDSYDSDTPYQITSYTTAAVDAVPAQKTWMSVSEDEFYAPANVKKGKRETDTGTGFEMEETIVEAQEAIEGSNDEVFGGTITGASGLRKLPEYTG